MTNQELLKELSFLKKKIKKLEESESQQKPTAMALHKSDDKYRQLAEDMPALICTFLPDSTLTYVNKAYCELFQKQPDDLVGQKFLDFLPDEATRENVRRQYISLTPENPVKTYDHEVIVSDGTNQYHWHRWTDRAFFSDNGQISHFQSIGQDITEHKRIEAALRESESFLNTLLNSIPIPVFYKDREGRYLGFNRAFETFFGTNKAQIIGKTVFDINPPDLAEIYHAKDTELFENGVVQHYESQVKNVLGPVRDVIFYKAIFADNKGTIIGLIGAILDVTERKLAEAALAAETHQLAETNTTLRVLLQRREEDQKEMERKILENIRKLVLPHLEGLRSFKLNDVQTKCLDTATANLQQVTSPFLKNLSARSADFTPREIQVANMVREGKTSKEIASLLNSSTRSVEFHRDNIRKKLGLNQKKSNLRIFLMNLSE